MTFRLFDTWKTSLVALVVGLVTGFALEFAILQPKTVKAEPPALAVRQRDKSLELERKPETAPVLPHVLPKGAKLEREIQVTVKPSPGVMDKGNESSPDAKGNFPEIAPCPPVRVDISLVRMPDATRRVIASSPDGEVVGGLDVPVEASPQPRDLKWAAGGIWNPLDKTYGFFVDRDLGPFRLGAEVFQVRGMQGITWAGQIKTGVRF